MHEAQGQAAPADRPADLVHVLRELDALARRARDGERLLAGARDVLAALTGARDVWFALRRDGEDEPQVHAADDGLAAALAEDPYIRAQLRHVVASGAMELVTDIASQAPLYRLRARRGEALDLALLPLTCREGVVGVCGLELAPRSGAADGGALFTAQFILGWLAALLENERLAELATVDGLTGLANQRQFQRALERELARSRRRARPCALVLLDLDRFKDVNDTLGHQAGDEVLRTAADIVRRAVRTEDVACRYGGEEFAIVLPDTDGPSATGLAERIRAMLAAMPIVCRGRTIRVTASFGIAAWPAAVEGMEPAVELEELVAAADRALYRAKHGGRNRVELAPHLSTETDGEPAEDPVEAARRGLA